MPWVGINEAMSVLGCSERTIYRRISKGSLATHRDNGLVLVDVPAHDTVAEGVRQMARVATAGAVQRSKDSDMLSVVIDEMRHARRVAVVASATGILATVACLGVTGYIAVQYHQETVCHGSQVAELRHTAEVAERRVIDADRRATEAIEDRDQVLDAHLAGFGFQVASTSP